MRQNRPVYPRAWCSPPQFVEPKLQWAVVAQNTHGASYLFFVPLGATDTGERTFEELRNGYQRAARSACKESWFVLLLTRTVVGTAKIQWVKKSVMWHVEEKC